MSALQAVVLTVLYTVANPARGLLEHEYEYIQRLCTGCCNVQPTCPWEEFNTLVEAIDQRPTPLAQKKRFFH